MESAVSMAAGGSLKSGAGLVSCAVSESVARSMQKVSLSTINFLLAGTLDGALAESSVKKILEYADKRKVDALALGPGMGTSKSTAGLVNNLIKKFKHPMIIDADALNCISSNTDILKKREKGMTVITPHPGEMQRLCGRKKEGILEDPVSVAEEFARKYSVVVVLKGYRSIVSDGKRTFINSTGSPGMAVGGSGDILSGIIATLMAQGFNPLEAAKTGVWVHGRAGDIAVWNRSERASLPEDFLAEMERV